MMASHLLKAAKDAVNAVFSDTTVPRATTRELLEELQADIDTMLDSMDEDDEEDAT